MISMSSATMMPGMIGTGPEHRFGGRTWRDVVAAWTLAVVLTCALLFAVPKPDDHGSSAHVQSFVSVPMHAHRKAPDVEGPSNEEDCSERDYVNERC